ncbi:MAG: sulfite exporter TauE/SafE family protein [Sediminibacterium sp.]|nr:MAG: sulfite exporter TauE/SafE family protein [Sediminibacterium sp.]
MTITLFLILLMIGGIVGYYSGLIGTGGNIILIPVFDILFHYLKIPETEVVKFMIAHSFFITAFTGLSVSYKQFKAKNLHLKEVLYISVAGMITAFFLTEFIKNGNWYHKSDFDLVFFTLLLILAIRMLFFKQPPPPINDNHLNKPYFPIIGIVAGLISSLSGLGGGIIVIPILTDMLKTPLKKASSISIGVVAMLALPISISYLSIDARSVMQHVLPAQVGYISMFIAAPVLIGVFSTTGWGVRTAQKSNPNTLRLILGIVVIILCAKMVYGFIANSYS